MSGPLATVATRVQEQAESHAQLIATKGIKTIREARREVVRCVETLRLSAEEAKRNGGAVVAVAADANLEVAASAIHSGAFWAAGQNCVHAQRIIVDARVASELREGLIALAERMRLGPKRAAEQRASAGTAWPMLSRHG